MESDQARIGGGDRARENHRRRAGGKARRTFDIDRAASQDRGDGRGFDRGLVREWIQQALHVASNRGEVAIGRSREEHPQQRDLLGLECRGVRVHARKALHHEAGAGEQDEREGELGGDQDLAQAETGTATRRAAGSVFEHRVERV